MFIYIIINLNKREGKLKNFSKKIAIAAIPVVMALSAPKVESKILLMSQEGWEVSFDGAANAFVMKNSATVAPTSASIGANGAATFETAGGVIGGGTGGESVGIVTGLLPNVWGMTLKAPTSGGIDMQARLGLYTHMNGGENGLGNGQLNIRETNGSISGSFGTILIGRSLGIHQSSAILNDMLLFGSGAAATGASSNTTLGRIGLGYLYTDFQPQVSWTTPGLGPLGFKVGIFDPMEVHSETGAADATELTSPRVEAEVTYATSVSGVNANFWVDATYQYAEFTTAAQAVSFNGSGTSTNHGGEGDKGIDTAGVGFGAKLSYDKFSAVVTGFYASGLGMRSQRSVGPITGTTTTAAASSGALDALGKPRQTYGGYAQITADLGALNVGYSYGGNYAVQTGNDLASTTVAEIGGQTMHSAMAWHNVTDQFRIIIEGGFVERGWHLGAGQEDTFGGVGGFFFW